MQARRGEILNGLSGKRPGVAFGGFLHPVAQFHEPIEHGHETTQPFARFGLKGGAVIGEFRLEILHGHREMASFAFGFAAQASDGIEDADARLLGTGRVRRLEQGFERVQLFAEFIAIRRTLADQRVVHRRLPRDDAALEHRQLLDPGNLIVDGVLIEELQNGIMIRCVGEGAQECRDIFRQAVALRHGRFDGLPEGVKIGDLGTNQREQFLHERGGSGLAGAIVAETDQQIAHVGQARDKGFKRFSRRGLWR